MVRTTLLVVGLVLTLWVPFSFFYEVWLLSPVPGSQTEVCVVNGIADLQFIEDDPQLRLPSVRFRFTPAFRDFRQEYLWPRYLRDRWLNRTGAPITTLWVSFPLWYLPALCLAWPVTSFILARRRRKGRGFEVEAKPGAAVPPPESPPARASDT